MLPNVSVSGDHGSLSKQNILLLSCNVVLNGKIEKQMVYMSHVQVWGSGGKQEGRRLRLKLLITIIIVKVGGYTLEVQRCCCCQRNLNIKNIWYFFL